MNKTELLPYPEVKSLNTPCKNLVVLLHGLGSDGNDLIGLVPFIQKELSDCYFISPHGVEPFDMAPYGRQWFSLNDRSLPALKELVVKNVSLLKEIIKSKQIELNLTNRDTMIIGFSQGAMMGLYLNFTEAEPFNCVVGFSGRLIPPKECINKSTPVCLVHGVLDDVVDISSMDEIIEYLKKYNIQHTSYKIQNLAHSIDASGLQYAVEFIKKNIR
jgi:phospholipase/carboxylesterase